MDVRIGLGQDSHRFCDKGRKGLVLGGVKMDEEVKLKGNSDADVVLHAIFNAISSGMGGRSISLTADKMCLERGIIDSSKYLDPLLEKMGEGGFKINNLSISIECKKPKIEPVVLEMKARLSEILGIGEDRIGITATSGEGLTDFGRGEGVQCFVAVTLMA